MTWHLIVFIVSFFVLAKSSAYLVKSLTSLARFFRLSEYLVAFLFMSIATSIPELFVGISSAVKNIPEFSLGNVLGANLINITLMIGLVVFLGNGLRVDSKISRRNFWIISGFAFLPLLLAGDGVISRGDGGVLLLAFVFYLLRMQKEKEYFSKTINHVPRSQELRHGVVALKNLSTFLIGIVFLMVSSYAIVWSGGEIVERTVLNTLSFGILFIAIGTALPELAFGIRAQMSKHGTMAVGNSLGCIAFTSTMVLGIVSLINPIEINISPNLLIVAFFLFVGLIAFNFFVFSKSLISRKEGGFLLLLYVSFLIVEYFYIMA